MPNAECRMAGSEKIFLLTSLFIILPSSLVILFTLRRMTTADYEIITYFTPTGLVA
jgi:hypothetical protein